MSKQPKKKTMREIVKPWEKEEEEKEFVPAKEEKVEDLPEVTPEEVPTPPVEKVPEWDEILNNETHGQNLLEKLWDIVRGKRTDLTKAQQTFLSSLRSLLREAIDIFAERQKEYGDSWYGLSPEEIAGIMHLKLQRLRKLSGKPESKDSIMDLIVYAGFYKAKMKEAGKW